MKILVMAVALAFLLVAGTALAGPLPQSPVPVLGDVGTVLLGLGLMGGGLAAIRRRRSRDGGTTMKIRIILVATSAVFFGSAAFAGIPRTGPVPALGDAGVVMLALGLLGAGVSVLRRGRKR